MSDPQLFDQDAEPTPNGTMHGCYLPRDQHIYANQLIIDTVRTLIAYGERWLVGSLPDSVMIATTNYAGIQLQVFARQLAQESAINQATSDIPDDLATFGEVTNDKDDHNDQ